MDPHQQTSQPIVSNMVNPFSNGSSNKENRTRKGRRLSQLTFQESRSNFKTTPKNTLEKTDENFPSLGNSKESTPAFSPPNIPKQQYINGLQDYETIDKNINKIPPGWIHLYYKNGKICKEYGPPPLYPLPDYTNYFRQQEINKYIQRVEEYDYLQHDGFILPHVDEFIPCEEEVDCSLSDSEYESDYEISDDDGDFYDY